MRRFPVIVGMLLVLGAMPLMAQEEAEAEKPEPAWVGSLGLSWVSTSGNTDTTTGGLEFLLDRKPEPWGLAFVARGNRAEQDGETTAENYLVAARVLRTLGERWEAYGGLQYARDPFAGVDGRLVASAGATYLAVESAKHKLSFDMALAYTSEDRVPPEPDVSFPGGEFGLIWEWKLGENSKLTERLMYYPNFDDSADWRVASLTGLESAINSWLALKLAFDLRHRNEPVGDNESTDTTTTASVVFNF